MSPPSTDPEHTLPSSSNVEEDNMVRPKRSGHGGGDASRTSSVVNLLNTIVGAGTLAMPAVMSKMGVTLGILLMVWSGLTSAFGLYLQGRCARYLDRGKSSFFALSQITYPNLAIIFDAAIAIKCFGVGVSYMIIIGDLMPGVVLGFDENAEEVPFLVDRKFWITAFMLPVILLAFLKRLDSLKYTSLAALVSIGYLAILVVYHFMVDDLSERGPIRVIEWAGPVATLSSLPVVVFAYTCHQNMFSILNEIADYSPGNVVAVVGSSIGSAASIYMLVAITGYLTFGNEVTGNIVSMYVPSAASTLAKAAIALLVTFSIPLQIHPCRASIDAVLKWRPNGAQNGSTASPSRPLLPSSSADGSRSDHAPAGIMSELRFAIITTVILILSYITALSVTSLDTMLAYVGSTGSTSISFILPGLFYYKISDPDGVHYQRLSKESDDLDSIVSDDTDSNCISATPSTLRSIVGSAASATLPARLRRAWRWDLEHVDHGLLRKMALALSYYGVVVMVVCLVMNTWFSVTH